MHLLQQIRQILKETSDMEIWLSQMSMNTLFCESEFLGVTQKYLIIKILGVEFLVETGVEKEFEREKEISYFRIETIQDCYQRNGTERKITIL